MTTPTGGSDDPNQGWSQPTAPGGGMPPPPPAQGYSPPGYDQPAQPGYGQPYGAPTGGGALAGFWIRFAAAIIDAILLSIVAFVLGLVTGMDGMNDRNVLSSLIGAVYFTYFHGSSGQSLGQKLVSIKVVDEANGGPIDYVRAFIRWLVSIVSGIVILLGYLWMLWDPKKQTWHDKAARTLVVKV